MTINIQCPQCGAQVKADARFCERCGARLDPVVSEAQPLPDAEAGQRVQGEPAAEAEARPDGARGEAITWEYAAPILTNAFMAWDLGRVLAISLVALYVIVFAIGWVADGEPVMLPLELVGMVAGILVVLFGIAGLVVLGNRFHMQFTVDADGVVTVTGQRERRINRVVTAIGALALLTGRPGPLDSALIATSQEVTGIRWRDVHKVTVHNRMRVVSLSDSWHTAQRLYCTPENFGPVVERAQAEFAEAQRWRAAHPSRSRPVNYWPLVIWGALAIVAGIAATAWEGDALAGFAAVAAVFALLAGLATGPAQRLFGGLGLAVTASYLVGLAAFAMEKHQTASGLISWYGYESDTELFELAAAGGVVLLAMSLWRLFGPSGGWPRGRSR
jgi:hypothetical protein